MSLQTCLILALIISLVLHCNMVDSSCVLLEDSIGRRTVSCYHEKRSFLSLRQQVEKQQC